MSKNSLVSIFLKKEGSGQSIILKIDGPPLPEDYIVIVRGSPKGINKYRFIDLIPTKIRLYFLEYLEFHSPIKTHNGNHYSLQFISSPENYRYVIFSLYSLNNHTNVGSPILVSLE